MPPLKGYKKGRAKRIKKEGKKEFEKLKVFDSKEKPKKIVKRVFGDK